MRLLIFGTNPRAERVIPAVVRAGYEVAAIVTEPGREAIERLAGRLSLPCFAPEKINAPDSVEILSGFGADAFLVLSYGQIFGKTLLDLPPLGVFNCHGGRLPEYRGSSVLSWQVINGENEIGVSIIRLVEEIDAGPVALERTFPIEPDDGIDIVQERANALFEEMTLVLLDGLSKGTVPLTPQDESRAHYWTRRRPDDGWIDWSVMTPGEVHNLTRALRPPVYPGSFSYVGGRKIVIVKTRIPKIPIHAPAGRIARRLENGVVVGCRGNEAIVVEEVWGEGSEPVSAAEHFLDLPAWFDRNR